MKLQTVSHPFLPGIVVYLTAAALIAAEPSPPTITNFSAQGSERTLRFEAYPAAEGYTILGATNPAGPFTADAGFALSSYTNAGSTNVSGYEWRSTNGSGPAGFYQIAVTPMDSNALLSAIVLNRLTYGSTPDELERIHSIGPDAFIAEQLAPWDITENAGLADAAISTIGATFADADEYVSHDTNATLVDLRAWHVLRAVNADRQLLEILLQFVENHFVTEYGKTYNDLGAYHRSGSPNRNDFRKRIAAQLEYRENAAWRSTLVDPQGTFRDLLKTSAESPAMILYLDTVDNRGDNGRIANENYARELCELFCCGVDNGYDQTDIEEIAKGWTGWRIEKVDLSEVYNPHALVTTNIVPGSTNASTTDYSNLYGAWAFHYREDRHNNDPKTIFSGKTVPARFGAPWAGQNYELMLTNGSGTNGIQDGYQIVGHMADLPFTAEYLSVKLCRLLVHDGFPNPTTNTNLSEYAYYDYASGNLTPEAELVHACMLAWETNSPKGQIWKVVKTITDSELFRSHAAAMQKTKTPLEFCASAIRALRHSTNGSNLDGTFTASTDGYSISGSSSSVDSASTSPLNRMGRMLLFDREAPDGYAEAGPSWISAGTLAERTRFIQSYCIAQGEKGHTGGSSVNDAVNCVSDPVRLLESELPAASRTNAAAVAGYFLDILYPAIGAGNLELFQQSAKDFLNTDVNGVVSPFSSLTPDNTPGSDYDTRVRGMVGLLMTSPRFHEQ